MRLCPHKASYSSFLFDSVSEEGFLTDADIVEAREATEEDLLLVHTKRYLNKLKVGAFLTA